MSDEDENSALGNGPPTGLANMVLLDEAALAVLTELGAREGKRPMDALGAALEEYAEKRGIDLRARVLQARKEAFEKQQSKKLTQKVLRTR